jgi:AcrR family transcriptional regulator
MPPARTKDRLLDAAATVVHRDGAQALTLDAVAKEAEVSKGGLLYHFKSKNELVEAMVERWMAEFGREIDESDPAFVRGYVKASAPAGNELGMLAALVADPSLLVAVRRQYGIWQDRVERESRDPVDATVARLAADGLWLAELLGMGPPTGELREQVLRRLSDLAKPVD